MKNIHLTLFAVFTVLVGVALSFYFNPIVVWGAITLSFAGFSLIGHPKTLIIFVVIWVFFSELFMMIFRNELITKVDELLILGILAVYIGSAALRKSEFTPLLKLYLGLISFSLFSMVINRTSLSSLGLMFFAYFSLYMVYMITYINIKYFSYRGVINLILVIYGVNLILNLAWGLRINPIYNDSLYTVDFAKGSLGVCNHVAYFTILVFSLIFSLMRSEGDTGRKFGYGLFAAFAVVQFYFTYTSHAYLFFIMMVPVYFFAARLKVTIKVIVFGFLLCIVFFGAVSLGGDSGRGGDFGLLSELSVKNIEKRYRIFLEEPKVSLFNRVVVNGMDDGTLQWFIGHGPGSGAGGVARTHPTPYTFEILGDYFLTQSGKESMRGGSVTQSPFSGITSIWSELGLIGTLLFYGLYIYPVFFIYKKLRMNLYKYDRYQRILAESFVLYGCLFMALNVLMDLFVIDSFVALYWFLAALVWRPVKEESSGQLSSEAPSVS